MAELVSVSVEGSKKVWVYCLAGDAVIRISEASASWCFQLIYQGLSAFKKLSATRKVRFERFHSTHPNSASKPL